MTDDDRRSVTRAHRPSAFGIDGRDHRSDTHQQDVIRQRRNRRRARAETLARGAIPALAPLIASIAGDPEDDVEGVRWYDEDVMYRVGVMTARLAILETSLCIDLDAVQPAEVSIFTDACAEPMPPGAIITITATNSEPPRGVQLDLFGGRL